MSQQPTRRERFRPAEFITLSAVIALFAGLVVLLTTRDGILAFVIFCIAFILTLVTIALLALAIKPGAEERTDLDEQDRGH